MTKRTFHEFLEEDDTIPSLFHLPANFHASRVRSLTTKHAHARGDCVVLWMSRDQRVRNNYALYYAQSMAISAKVPLKVVFNLVPRFLDATLRQYAFMIKGLQEVEKELRGLNIPFYLLRGDPTDTIPQFIHEVNASLLVTDFSPLRTSLGWCKSIAAKLDAGSERQVPFMQVDAHNIVPCWVSSSKLEYSARTFRLKISPLIPQFLQDIPSPVANEGNCLEQCPNIDWEHALASLEINRNVHEVSWLASGSQAASQMLDRFISDKLLNYEKYRNDPNKDFVSNMSPYLHFGQIGAQEMIMRLKAQRKQGSSVDSFIEEAVVRRELSDNFCFYNQHYDSLEGCYKWARETLDAHRHDARPALYSRHQLEHGQTRDDLWNAAQIQLLTEGKMHGFLRMYWAKKILEWTSSPEDALSIAIFLNDKYQLDGRDPNGYVGCMWSIGGVHDQGWAERSVFGKIRYMNYQGCLRKFDVKAFVKKYPPAEANALAAQQLPFT